MDPQQAVRLVWVFSGWGCGDTSPPPFKNNPFSQPGDHVPLSEKGLLDHVLRAGGPGSPGPGEAVFSRRGRGARA